MPEFALWVDRRGTVRMLCLPFTAHRPCPVHVFESFVPIAPPVRPRVCTSGAYQLIHAESTDSLQVSEKTWLKEGFVPLGTRSFVIFDLDRTLRAVGRTFMDEVLDRIAGPVSTRPLTVSGDGDIAVVEKLIAHLRGLAPPKRRVPSIRLFSHPAPASRYNF